MPDKCACGLRPCLIHFWEQKTGKTYDPGVRVFDDFQEDRQPVQKKRRKTPDDFGRPVPGARPGKRRKQRA